MSMAKKDQSDSKTKTPKIYSTTQNLIAENKLQISEGSSKASSLIGSIIEKGISNTNRPFFSPTPPPKPSVLPFPVARHRSHGPHWDPIGSQKGDELDNGKYANDGEDGGIANFDPISTFANPVQRKEKKGLDFSSWKKTIPGDRSSMANKMEENTSLIGKVEKQRMAQEATKIAEKQNILGDPSIANEDLSAHVAMDVEPHAADTLTDYSGLTLVADMEVDNSNQLRVEENVKGAISGSFKEKQESMFLESEIDAENRARLRRMAPDEIAEAQAEIMEKMNPALLNFLKKRGQDKLKKQGSSILDMATNGKPGVACDENQFIQDAKGSSFIGSDLSLKLAPSKNIHNVPEKGVVQNFSASNGSLWNAWSERVEVVRHLRFSLDGTVVDNNFGQIAETGDSVQHSVDSVTERDFLRTEGDPGAAGYTIKEAVALTRSVVPGQRALALHLLASVLDKALNNIYQKQVGSMQNENDVDKSIDWEAVWAFVLGPEPELVLSLRMSLDDNHDSVVLACAKAIQCILSCELNENFFDISEKIAFYGKDICTAPVFRRKPEIDVGFLHGGFWKYNAKPSSIPPFSEDFVSDDIQGKHTIQDDIFLAQQDFAAGLVRMGILPRIRYLLETNPTAALEECIISTLIAIARHSPTCANAVMKCERLVQTVVHRFTIKSNVEVHPSHIKSVCLLRVLAGSDKKHCLEFIKSGIFQAMTWQLYQCVPSLDPWVKLGREKCKLSSALMIEQLRFWKVCIQYEYCVSYFPDIFSALCLWLTPPTFEKLIKNNVLSEFASISKEAFLVLEALARTLPNFYSQKLHRNQIPECADNDMETWSWSYVSPIVDLATNWLSSKSELFNWKEGIKTDIFQDRSVTPLLWVYSAVMHMLSSVLERVSPDLHGSGVHVPWLPEFVPKVGLEIIRNGFLSFSGSNDSILKTDFAGGRSFIEDLCYLRQQSKSETSLASVCCLYGLVRVVISIDNLIRLAKAGIHNPGSQGFSISRAEDILEHGVLKASLVEFRFLLNIFMQLIASEWHFVQSIEKFGRGGPAPGLGFGWGASGGGFWSMNILLAQTDAWLLIHLLDIFQNVPTKGLLTNEEMAFAVQGINSALGVCVSVGPRDKVIMEKALDIMLQVHTLKFLNLCIQHFLQFNRRTKLFGWEYKEEDYLLFSETLGSHFRNRWLCIKKTKAMCSDSSSCNTSSEKGSMSLETIHEDLDMSNMTSEDHPCTSLVVEWAHQRLPLPMHWFLSPISTICDSKHAGLQSSNALNLMQDNSDVFEVAKGGLFLLLGFEAMCAFLPMDISTPVRNVPLIWKLHSLSVILLAGMGVLEEEKSRDVYQSLQQLYGQLVDEARSNRSAEFVMDKCANLLPETEKKDNVEFLRFQSEVHESYSTFIETLVEQYAAISYGDMVYGRQVAVYLHRSTEAPVRLAAWNALSNARVLELLPPLQECFTDAEGYLEPVEDNEAILDAYVKSWISSALDKAATRRSVAFTLVMHHLSSFIFLYPTSDSLSLRNKLAKSLLRDYYRKPQHKGMMLDLIRYHQPSTLSAPEQKEGSSIPSSIVEDRFEVLKEACEGSSTLLTEVEKLKTLVR
ncbi:RPAP1_C domain-containing protein/RPAP1_N domain-containing protein [Cephalotus follicularis]|uniref:RPAP1_C domain-containing protein/RPAP1_N domain-containing protein n=1 Tax=Cephalotus follicularis TaxID=3775 RepID=A0A1Q3D298_CEPFO|nr:RPAP1_C domain-containing protein/RPAP1_N domain-containing protein [Cephalotus follicularis]